MKLTTLGRWLNLLWILIVVIGGLQLAATNTAQIGTTTRWLLVAGAVSAFALLILGYLFRGVLFSRKSTAEMTSNESMQIVLLFVLSVVCIGIVAAIGAFSR